MVVKKSCVFGLCVKNNSVGLPKVFENISKICYLFDKVQIVAYYDPSPVNTIPLLRELSDKYKLPLEILNETCNAPISRIRTINIARARNGIIQWLRSEQGKDYELFAFMDSNDYSCQGNIRPNTLEKYLNEELFNKWDSLSFIRLPYYDLWAFSNAEFQIGLWSYPDFGSITPCSKYHEDMVKHIENEFLEKEKRGQIIPVDSAFCGFAIYKKSKYINCSYCGIINLINCDKTKLNANLKAYPLKRIRYNLECEHRPFHMMATRQNNAQMYMACDFLFDIREEDMNDNLRRFL